jgi:hypothetical protein
MDERAAVGHEQVRVGRVVIEPQPARAREKEPALGDRPVRADLQEARFERADGIQIAFRARAVGVAGAGAVTLASVLVLAPKCIGDPLGGLDPVVRDLWLSQVVEAKPLLSLWPTAPSMVVATAAPVLIGLLAALGFAWRSEGVARRRWLLMAASIAAAMSLAGAWILRLRAGQASSSEVETPTRTSGRGRSGYLTGTLLGMLMTLPALVIPFDLAGVHAVGPRFIVFHVIWIRRNKFALARICPT